MKDLRNRYVQKKTGRLLALGLCAAAVAVALGIALSATAGQRKAAPSVLRAAGPVRLAGTVSAPTGKLRARTINAALQRSFAMFRRRPSGPVGRAAAASRFQELVPDIVTRWRSRDAPVLGQASAQNVELVAAGDAQVAVLAGTQGACLAAWTVLPGSGGGYAAVCGPARSVAASGLTFTVHTAAGVSRVVGLVPNGNSNVTATLASGQTESVPVVSNVFNVTSNGGPAIEKVSFLGAGGALRTIAGGS